MINKIEESEKYRKRISKSFGFEVPSFTKKPTFYYDLCKLLAGEKPNDTL